MVVAVVFIKDLTKITEPKTSVTRDSAEKFVSSDLRQNTNMFLTMVPMRVIPSLCIDQELT